MRVASQKYKVTTQQDFEGRMESWVLQTSDGACEEQNDAPRLFNYDYLESLHLDSTKFSSKYSEIIWQQL